MLLQRRRARASLLAFTRFTKPDYEVAPVHSQICEALDRVMAGKCPRLMIFAPPRMGKSELVSRRLPAMMLGRFPGCNIITASYSADLAASMGRDVKRVIDSPAYQELYPGVRFGELNQAMEFRLSNGSTYKTAGVGGSITGRGFGATGAEGASGGLALVDDPVKSREEADSKTMRDRVWEWWVSDLLSRRESINTPIVLMHQRWHEDDLAGRILRQDGTIQEGGEWEVLSLPIVNEAGESIWPSKFTDEFIEKARRENGSREWASKYMQTPMPDGGGIFKRQTFRYYTQAGTALTDLATGRQHDSNAWRRFATMDIAVTTKASSDWTVMGIWAQSPDKKLWLIDLIRDRMETPALLDLIASARHRYGVPTIYIESNGVGLPIFQSAQARKLPVLPVEQHKDKVSRAQAATPWFERGDVMFPRDAPWLSTLEAELLSFPAGTWDDQVDCLTTAIALADGQAFGYSVAGAASGTLAPRSSASDYATASAAPNLRGHAHSIRKDAPKRRTVW